MPVVELTTRNPITLNLDEFFIDPDAETLTFTLVYDAESSAASVVVEESILTVTPLEVGTASFLVTATDVAGFSVTVTIEVSVASPPPTGTDTHTYP